MTVIHAIFENGVFRPTEPVELPDKARVRIILSDVGPDEGGSRLDAIYEVLAERHHSGQRNLAERHDGHQPLTR
jgi:predicted DNA-binding antitoxin AbrB/MazE fold protein